jgi:hypothetical protein
MLGANRGARAAPAVPFLVVVATVVVALAGCGTTKTVTSTVTETTTVSVAEPTDLEPPSRRVEFGHIRAVKPVGGHFEMTFDPALMLMGETANRAAQEDGVVGVGEPVPNDNYVVDESPRTYSYIVADDARVTLLVRTTPQKWAPTKESVAELVKVVAGTSALNLYEPLDSGTWITVDVDTVRAIYQQYRP